MSARKKKIVMVGGIIFLNVLLFLIVIQRSNQMLEVPVAKQDILPRTIIKDEMIKMVKVPKKAVFSNMQTNKKEIIGKVSAIQGYIPKGSYFYLHALDDKKQVKDAPAMALKKGQSAFSLPCNLIMSGGNSIVAFQHVDVYVTIEERQNSVTSDVLLQNVRVLSMKDRNGVEIDEEGIPYVCILAVKDEQIPLLKTALKKGNVDIYAIPASKYKNEESVLSASAKLLEALK